MYYIKKIHVYVIPYVPSSKQVEMCHNTRSISAKHVCQTCIGWGDSEERLI